MSVRVTGPVVDVDERYQRIVIYVREAMSSEPPIGLVGGYAVCPMEKAYTNVSDPEADELLEGHVISFEVTGR